MRRDFSECSADPAGNLYWLRRLARLRGELAANHMAGLLALHFDGHTVSFYTVADGASANAEEELVYHRPSAPGWLPTAAAEPPGGGVGGEEPDNLEGEVRSTCTNR